MRVCVSVWLCVCLYLFVCVSVCRGEEEARCPANSGAKTRACQLFYITSLFSTLQVASQLHIMGLEIEIVSSKIDICMSFFYSTGYLASWVRLETGLVSYNLDSSP